jgi:hypothetical protein
MIDKNRFGYSVRRGRRVADVEPDILLEIGLLPHRTDRRSGPTAALFGESPLLRDIGLSRTNGEKQSLRRRSIGTDPLFELSSRPESSG